jgi:predicted PurR-regulated permease PerM
VPWVCFILHPSSFILSKEDLAVLQLNLSAATRWGLNLLVLLGLIAALSLGKPIFVPMIIALLLAAMLWPAAKWLNSGVPYFRPVVRGAFPWLSLALARFRVPWSVASVFLVSLLVTMVLLVPAGFGLTFVKILQEVQPERPGQQLPVIAAQSVTALAATDLSSELTQLTLLRCYQDAEKERQWVSYAEFRKRVYTVAPALEQGDYIPKDPENFPIFQGLKNMLDPNQPYFVNNLGYVAMYGGNWLWDGILIMFMLLFLMLEGRMLSRRVTEIFGPSNDSQEKAVKVLESMAAQVRVYLVWRSIVNFGLAVVLGTFYHYVGLKHAWSWALLTAIVCYIPYLGQIVACVPPVLDAFLACSSPWYALVVLGFYVAVMVIEGYVIVPVVMGRPMQLNATTVLLACLFWYLVWGTMGLFLAMPLMAAVKAICTHVPGWEAWANLMSTREPEPPKPPPEPLDDYNDTEVLSPEEALAHRAALEALARKRRQG